MTDHSSGENGKEDIIIETETPGEDNAPRGGHIHILGMSLYLIALIAYQHFHLLPRHVGKTVDLVSCGTGH